jgi:hypothetical protein
MFVRGREFGAVANPSEDPDFVQILRRVNSHLGKGDNPALFAVLPMVDVEELPIDRRLWRGRVDTISTRFIIRQHKSHKCVSAVAYTKTRGEITVSNWTEVGPNVAPMSSVLHRRYRFMRMPESHSTLESFD